VTQLVEYNISVNESQRLAYIPKVILQALGHKLTIVPNSNAAIIFPKGEDPSIVLRSLEIILQDLKLRAELSNESRKRL
jgi:hypothetical protein